MAEENEEGKKKPQKSKLSFFSLYEQLEKDNPNFTVNKIFWSRKGNSQKYVCTLCNIGVQMSPNVNTLKTAILTHINDKYHKKRLENYLSAEDKMKDNLPSKSVSNKSEQLNWCKDVLVDFDTIYNSFEKCNPVIKTSKQFITKLSDGKHYFCTLCEELIFNSLNANEFRYNLWVHLNDENHRKRLPNYLKVQKYFDKVMKNLSNTIPSCFKEDLKYFEIGPVFRFVKCSLCEVAVSVNLHRLENHIRDFKHIEKKEGKKQINNESLPDRTRNAFRKLVVQIEDSYKKDIKYIQIGKIPGYVICTLCTYVVLPTQFYVQTHFQLDVHLKNKSTGKINKNSKFKIRLEDLMNTLPEDFMNFNIFEENMCGLTCKRCKVSIPATSYDLYSHINKERHSCVN